MLVLRFDSPRERPHRRGCPRASPSIFKVTPLRYQRNSVPLIYVLREPVGTEPQDGCLIRLRVNSCLLLFCHLFYESVTNSTCNSKLQHPRRSQVTPVDRTIAHLPEICPRRRILRATAKIWYQKCTGRNQRDYGPWLCLRHFLAPWKRLGKNHSDGGNRLRLGDFHSVRS